MNESMATTTSITGKTIPDGTRGRRKKVFKGGAVSSRCNVRHIIIPTNTAPPNNGRLPPAV
jgi:hypothetical protein